ncbi:uncharacterized protein F5891DRAFT_982091 [Suillus fuscotomentosus]|uniref:Uncharacterized protein n=1 Tax=Suillus fuscotomentosus TaxID=1912939 RepID=A0AAD4E238_9AGAM|nr:uncharacterized protein F5891DRAFT_982091 [Suillus fuscotomentosus]KAG1898192.1 hypothetical protein F5891DRAFT_982091 [Suillus fuscotomentosus]
MLIREIEIYALEGLVDSGWMLLDGWYYRALKRGKARAHIHREVWEVCVHDGQGLFTDLELEVVVVTTQFDPSLSENRRFSAKHDGALNEIWTKKERELAEMGAEVNDLLVLQNKIVSGVTEDDEA